jgi:hypothetical protein
MTLHLESIADLAELASAVAGSSDLVVFYAGLGERDQEGARENELHLAAIPLRPTRTSVAGAGTEDSPTTTPGPRTPVTAVEAPIATVAPETPGLVAEPETSPAAGGPLGVIAGVGTAVVLVAGLLLAWLRSTRSGPREPMDRE